MKPGCFCLFFGILAGCNPDITPCPPLAGKDVVYVVEGGWHAEIGIPAAELGGGLSFYRNVFSGARVIMFGYGKKTFFTASPQTFSEYVLGPFPGPAVIHAVGIRELPPDAYPRQEVVTLALPDGGGRALSAYIANDLVKDAAGRVQVVARSHDPDGIFYAARSQYNLLHTCNSWTTEALHAAGLPVSASVSSFSGQTMSRARKVASAQCALLGNGTAGRDDDGRVAGRR